MKQAKEMTRAEVIKDLNKARLIHVAWASRIKRHKRQYTNAGGVQWHQRWIRTYENAIRILKADAIRKENHEIQRNSGRPVPDESAEMAGRVDVQSRTVGDEPEEALPGEMPDMCAAGSQRSGQ